MLRLGATLRVTVDLAPELLFLALGPGGARHKAQFAWDLLAISGDRPNYRPVAGGAIFRWCGFTPPIPAGHTHSALLLPWSQCRVMPPLGVLCDFVASFVSSATIFRAFPFAELPSPHQSPLHTHIHTTLPPLWRCELSGEALDVNTILFPIVVILRRGFKGEKNKWRNPRRSSVEKMDFTVPRSTASVCLQAFGFAKPFI